MEDMTWYIRRNTETLQSKIAIGSKQVYSLLRNASKLTALNMVRKIHKKLSKRIRIIWKQSYLYSILASCYRILKQ